MKDNEAWAWTAGFWEGEGSLIIQEEYSNFSVRIANTAEEGILFTAEHIGRDRCQIYFEKRRQQNHKDIYRLTVTGYEDILWFLNKIRPYVVFRKDEIDEGIKKIMELRGKAPNMEYSKEEIDFIKENYKNMLDPELAEKLGRPRSGIRQKRHKLDIVRWRTGLRRWTEEEERFLLENYGKMSIRDIAKKLGRTIDAISRRKSILKKRGNESRVLGFD